MISLLVIGAYIMAGLVHTLSRSWALGVHRAEAHAGREARHCGHWACDLMADDSLIIILGFLFWPVMLPCHWLTRLARAVMQAPYQRSLPPKNSVEDSRGNCPRCYKCEIHQNRL